MKIHLNLARSTKGTHVFEPDHEAEKPPVSALYIAKSAVPPGTKSVTVEFTFHDNKEG
jgi:hypothetical protein